MARPALSGMRGSSPVTWFPSASGSTCSRTPRDSGDGQAKLTKREAIFLWASQAGSAHQDWELNEEFERFRSSDLLTLGGRSPSVYWLQRFTETVVRVADMTMEKLTHERVEQRVSELSQGKDVRDGR
jgi:hypothetical protein